MWLAEIAERGLSAACADMDVTIRASRVDDETAQDTERKEYPALVIRAGAGRRDSIESLFTDVPMEVTLVTLYTDDPKRTELATLEDELCTIIHDGFKTEFDAAADDAGEDWYFKGLLEIEGSMPEIVENKEQSIMITFVVKACGS